MITFWKNGQGLRKIDTFERNCWIHVSNPTEQEKELLSKKFKVPHDFIRDILDMDERSRSELDPNWLLIILRIPVVNASNGVPYITIPLGILVSNFAILTICARENDIIPSVIKACETKRADLHHKVDFILQIFLYSATWYLNYLKRINIETNQIEKDLEKSTRNKELQKLLKMEKCLVFFITSLKSNELLLAKLRNSKFAKNNAFDEDLMDDVIIENKQALEMAHIYSDIQSGMMDAFASVISNNLNVILKQLTSVTIILMIPTLIASLYGMNVPNFLENNTFAFPLILLMSLLFSVFGVYLFRKKNWF